MLHAMPMLAATVLLGSHGTLKKSPPSPGPKIVARIRAALGGDFAECADRACLSRHEATCEAAHLARRYTTVEGTPGAVDTFLRKRDGRCQITSVLDMSDDYYGGCTIMVRTCPSLEADASDDSKNRGCTQRDVWTRSVCKQP